MTMNIVLLLVNVGAASGILPPFPNPIPAPTTFEGNLSISDSVVARSGGASYVGFNFDWHCGYADAPKHHCPGEPGWNHSSVNIGIDLNDPNLIAAVKALSPGRLRIGGTEADYICYDTTPGICEAKIATKKLKNAADSPAFILNMTRWQQIVDFCENTGIQLIFGLNGNTRVENGPIDWDANNTAAFVKYVSENNAEQIFGFELGNELCHFVTPGTYAGDIHALRSLVDNHWPKSITKPMVIGPDCNPMDSLWVDEYLGNVSGILDVYTYHNYVGYGLDPKLAQEMMSPDWTFFDDGPKRASDVITGWEKIGKPVGMELWAGEIAAAWHSGSPGVTNRFISSFWYADALGLLATLNHTGFQRQALLGGNYGLLNRTTHQPNPDFYVAQLFHDLMGPEVLNLTAGEEALSKGLRTYAQCHPSGGRATLLIINVSPSITFDLHLPNTDTFEVYTITAGDGTQDKWLGLDSRIVRLNGKKLDARKAGPLPPPTQTKPGDGLKVQPLSIVFAIMPDKALKFVCKDI